MDDNDFELIFLKEFLGVLTMQAGGERVHDGLVRNGVHAQRVELRVAAFHFFRVFFGFFRGGLALFHDEDCGEQKNEDACGGNEIDRIHGAVS